MASGIQRLSPAQRRLARGVVRRSTRRGATLREKLAALEAGIVESSLRDLPYGDRDSEGFLQQRPSTGWGPASENWKQDLDQFLDRAKSLRGMSGGAGKLAQAIQRSAFPDRYGQQRGLALALLRAFGGDAGGAPGGAGRAAAASVPGFDPGAPQMAGQALVETRPQIPLAGVQAPAFAAQAVLPAGYAQAPSSGGPTPRPPVAVPTGQGMVEDFTPGAAGGAQRQRGAGRGGLGGSSPSALLDELGGWTEKELGLKLGSRDRAPADNAAVGGAKDSDHLEAPGQYAWREAGDFPTTAQAGGWGQYRKVVRRLGLKPASNGFTQGEIKVGAKRYRVQVIFGDRWEHGDHIHVGFRKVG